MRVLFLGWVLMVFVAAPGCRALDTSGPQPRKRAPDRDEQCREPARPHAYFYAAENRTDYAPDDPFEDGCKMLVPDHLFCCPAATSSLETHLGPGDDAHLPDK